MLRANIPNFLGKTCCSKRGCNDFSRKYTPLLKVQENQVQWRTYNNLNLLIKYIFKLCTIHKLYIFYIYTVKVKKHCQQSLMDPSIQIVINE